MTKRKPTDNEEIVDGEILQVGTQRMKRKGEIFVPENPSAELFDGNAIEDADIMEPALQGVIAELGGADQESKVIVHRWENANGVKKQTYLFECHPNDFSLSDLQEAYGAGDYQIKVYGKQAGTNYKVIHANKKISVGPTRDQARGLARPVQQTPGVPALAQDGSAIARAIAETLGPVLAAQGQLLAKLAGNEGGGRKAMLEEMELMSRMFKTTEAPPAANPFANLKQAAELMQLFKGDGTSDPEAAPYALMGKAMDLFGEMYMQGREGAPQRVAARPARALPVAGARPAPAGVAAVAAVDNPDGGAEQQITEDEEMQIFLKGQLAIFLNAAKMGASPDTYGTLLYEQAPDELLEKIVAPNWFETLCQLSPEFSKYKEWAASVREIVLEEIEAAKKGDLTQDDGTGTSSSNVAEAPTGSAAASLAGTGAGKPAAG